jgi:uncharacterized protein YoxC
MPEEEPWCDKQRKKTSHLASIWDILCRLFGKGTHDIAQKIDILDRQQREVRHDICDIKFHTDALLHLVETMREDDAWNRINGKSNNVQ